MPRDSQPHLKVMFRPTTGFDLALDLFITAKQGERCTPHTIKTYRWTLQRFVVWLQAQEVNDAQSISAHHVRKYLADLDKQGYASSYIHIYARTIKTWLRFLYAEELLPTDPMTKVTMPRLDDAILPAFTPEDVRRLLGACTSLRDTMLVYCVLDTGCRAAELVALNVGDVDPKSGTVTVRQGKGLIRNVTLMR